MAPRQKAEKTPIQLAADKAREHYKAAKEKSAKAPNNENLTKALDEARNKMHVAVKAENRERFLTVGAKRFGKAIAAITLLKNVANVRAYEFGEADVAKGLAALKEAYETTAKDFETALAGAAKGEKKKPSFSFE